MIWVDYEQIRYLSYPDHEAGNTDATDVTHCREGGGECYAM
jgi:hypothetical protein